jgi:phospholipase C
MSDASSRANAIDLVVVVFFENRSLDNVLGHLYGPDDGKTFDGVIGKDLTNPPPDGPNTAPIARWSPTRPDRV